MSSKLFLGPSHSRPKTIFAISLQGPFVWNLVALRRNDLQVELIDTYIIHISQHAPTQYAPSFPLYCAFVAIQLEDSISTNLQPATLGCRLWISSNEISNLDTKRYHNLFSFARQTSFCQDDHPAVLLLSPRAVWWRVGSACGSTTNSSYRQVLLVAQKNVHRINW